MLNFKQISDSVFDYIVTYITKQEIAEANKVLSTFNTRNLTPQEHDRVLHILVNGGGSVSMKEIEEITDIVNDSFGAVKDTNIQAIDNLYKYRFVLPFLPNDYYQDVIAVLENREEYERYMTQQLVHAKIGMIIKEAQAMQATKIEA